ncbi:DNA-directed RNA polymerase, omega subunit [Flexistipes sinusarabici DSM 4947]|uniref:DNA-directed RNA polymerase subunit omega n=1 Tax=Flexistipes sinusarabici (strain ATCC 49648 / DSM 4947 / MAS 10) TaxID=717231 RepID=F8E8U1_FLESM|nr:DNA-directed RNA polymerase subunit omega [Flexistipes sinusarabici]AEI15214.1 DNA-directed RNA polymerase, omega subunit [Flexistipes sinusarabici DSM 4947]
MPLLDIEKGVRKKEIKSRFRLVRLAGLRSRELLNPKEDTLPCQEENYDKYTTKALSEIINGKIAFEPVKKETGESDE